MTRIRFAADLSVEKNFEQFSTAIEEENKFLHDIHRCRITLQAIRGITVDKLFFMSMKIAPERRLYEDRGSTCLDGVRELILAINWSTEAFRTWSDMVQVYTRRLLEIVDHYPDEMDCGFLGRLRRRSGDPRFPIVCDDPHDCKNHEDHPNSDILPELFHRRPGALPPFNSSFANHHLSIPPAAANAAILPESDPRFWTNSVLNWACHQHKLGNLKIRSRQRVCRREFVPPQGYQTWRKWDERYDVRSLQQQVTDVLRKVNMALQ